VSVPSRQTTREIGPIGSASRVVGGVAAIVAPLAVWGSTWWDWAAGLVGFPLLAMGVGAGVAALEASRSAPSGRSGWAPAFGILALVLGSATAVTFTSPVDGNAVWLFLGASMLLAAAKGYGGCEVLAVPSALTGRRYRTPCLLYGPIDAAEGNAGARGADGVR
jgi:hypothetical protein